MAFMQIAQRLSGAWSRDVDLFIAPSEFLRQQYIAAGFDASRIIVKPNFANHDYKVHDGDRGYALFVGRLSTEKGLGTLLAAWKQLPDIPLIIVGDGPQGATLRTSAEQLRNVTFVGPVGHSEVFAYVRRARYLVVPSECHETLSMVVLEAFACGTPVIASKVGGLPEVITDNRNGLFFRPKDPCDLACKAAHLWSDPEHASALGRSARSDYEARFSAEHNYKQLLEIYAKTLTSA
jgi:glycosyltransferase involved in cell wall biosynthesis